MSHNTDQQTKTEGTRKNIRLADELERLYNRISGTRVFRDMDGPDKQRVVAARRVKLGAAW